MSSLVPTPVQVYVARRSSLLLTRLMTAYCVRCAKDEAEPALLLHQHKPTKENYDGWHFSGLIKAFQN